MDVDFAYGYELIVAALKQQALKVMYGVVGIPVTELARAVQAQGMRFIGFHNEQAASMAASAYGFLQQKPGVCLTVSGPGFINGLAGLANATTNCFPMILMSGSGDAGEIALNQGPYQGLDQLDAARPFAKQVYKIERVEAIGQGIARAFRTALAGRPGGVYLDLPAKLLQTKIPKAEARLLQKAFTPLVTPVIPLLAPKAVIEAAFAVLGKAARPLLIIGKGAAYARAEQELEAFVTKTQLPFLTMPMAKGLLSDQHPLCANAARSLALGNADVIMLIGARLNWLLAEGASPPFAAAYQLIQVDICAAELDAVRPVDVPVVGELKAIMGCFAEAATEAIGQIEWLSALDAEKALHRAKLQLQCVDKMPMSFSCALRVIRDEIKPYPELFYVTEGANTLDFGRSIIDMEHPRKRLDPGTWGTMGVGLGYAIAAATLDQGRVLAVEGDAAFGFSAMELETICRYRLPIIMVIFNNGGIYKGDAINPHSTDPDPTTFMPNIAYEKLITAFAATGYEAGTPAALALALRTALRLGEPALINCKIDPTAGVESGHLNKLNA